MLIHGENGWLVEKSNVEQLAERLTWFIENQNGWQLMTKASRAMVEGKFDVTIHQDKLFSKDLF